MAILTNLVSLIVFIPVLTFSGLMGTFMPVGFIAVALIFLGSAVLQYLKPRKLTKRIWQWNFSVLGAWVVYVWILFYRHGIHV